MEYKNLKELFQHFNTEEVCQAYLEKRRWNGKPVCPYCNYDKKIYSIEKGKRWKCGNPECHKKFSVTVGSVFENSKIPLSTWLGALYLATAHKKGISSLQLCRDLSVTQKTAWFMLHRIREMLKSDGKEMMKGPVEIDEVYIGGKEGNKHANKKAKGDLGYGRSLTKSPVLGIVERGGKVYARKVAQATIETVKPIIEEKVKKGVTVYTDEWPGYQHVGINFEHFVINHSEKRYVNGDIHTNTIEGFWSLLKRGILGIYHSVSYKHLNAYCSEFSYRYNTRKVTDAMRLDECLPLCGGKRIKYKELTYNGGGWKEVLGM